MTLRFEVGPDGRILAGQAATDRQQREVISGEREDVTKAAMDAVTEALYVIYTARGCENRLSRLMDLADGRKLVLSLTVREGDE